MVCSPLNIALDLLFGIGCNRTHWKASSADAGSAGEPCSGVCPRSAKGVGAEFKQASVVRGDVLGTEYLSESVKGQGAAIAVLSGELLAYARSIATAMEKSHLGRILWVTGMGIHYEVPGEVGKFLDELCRNMPEYVHTADTIAAAGTLYTLIQAVHLTDGANDKYFVSAVGEPLHALAVDRVAVAHFIAALVENKNSLNQNLGVTN